jgi:signal peptidase I
VHVGKETPTIFKKSSLQILMKIFLRTSLFSALLCGSLVLPSVVSAHQEVAIRSDGSMQSTYSLRGHWIFVNRVSRRNIRQSIVEITQPELLKKEII